ncbi:hypothetical protein DLAC_08332 [Tieghemostelium lacteum]|uniref:Clu domain-containing protein n=1 Tax=Tieghemostelium lacteum TaxID=361077 RepID=A0A151ZBP8_TIELA|nr:hypothetical protein DLAC_08332 [Tieghemostelium lacteum]|eukprot:KYQ91377.1 hypothetical protein DLAC_08332 [Tieghemostelium lacteum]
MSQDKKDFSSVMSYWAVKDVKQTTSSPKPPPPLNKSSSFNNKNNKTPTTLTPLQQATIEVNTNYSDSSILTTPSIQSQTSYQDSMILTQKEEPKETTKYQSNHDQIYNSTNSLASADNEPDESSAQRKTTSNGRPLSTISNSSGYSDVNSYGDVMAYALSSAGSSVSSYNSQQSQASYGGADSYQSNQSSSEFSSYNMPAYGSSSGNDVYFSSGSDSNNPGLSSYSQESNGIIEDDSRAIELLNVCGTSDFKEINSNWNDLFQRLLDLPESEEKYKKLSNMASDFVYCADTFGKIIISELHLPEESKTIKPLALGGVAGGLKFKCQDIIFKFVVDTELYPGLWMYGNNKRSDEFAQKSANHEIKGLNHFMDISEGLIRFPLMTIIDYRGYRLLAISSLPIGKDTIVYGSCDAGKTVHNSNPKIYAEMERISKILNLREHEVGLKQTKIYGPGDIEIHEGRDGRFYMIDFARCFPPEYPLTFKPKKNGSDKVGREIFYSMLRPELLRESEKPLSSDALSGWQTSPTADEDYNQDVIKITEKLHSEIIPHTIKIIETRIESSTVDSTTLQDFQIVDVHQAQGENPTDLGANEEQYFLNLNPNAFHTVEKDYSAKIYEIKKLINYLHSKGINLRYLGVVVRNLKNRLIKQIFMTEVVARVWKRIIRFKLRQIMDLTKRPSEEPYKRMISKVFLTILNTNRSENREFWSECQPGQFKYLALSIFPRCISDNDLSSTVDLRSIIDPRLLVVRITQMLNIRINTLAYSQFLSDPQYIITARDIEEVGSTIKYPTIIDFAAGSVLLYETKKIVCQTQNYVPKEISRWIDSAQNKLSNALSSMPLSFKLIWKLATTYLFRANVTNDFDEGVKLLNTGVVMINLASASQRNHPLLIGLLGMIHLKLGTYYLFYTKKYDLYQKELDLARDRLTEALSLDPNSINDYIVQSFPISFACGALSNTGKFNHTRKFHELLCMVFLLNSVPKESSLHIHLQQHFDRVIQIENLQVPLSLSRMMDSQIIHELLQKSTNMQHLVMTKQSLNSNICQSIVSFKNLTSFSMNQVHFSTPKPGTLPAGEGIQNLNQFFKLLLEQCQSLKHLKLFSRSIEHETLEGSYHLFNKLENLEILDTYLNDKTLEELAPHIGNLTHLSLSHSYDFTDNGVSQVIGGCLKLIHLNISYLSKLTDTTAKAIVKNLHQLQYLNLSRVKFSSEMMAEIVKAQPMIEKLYISDTSAGLPVVEALESHGAMHLTELSLRHTNPISNENYLEILSNMQPKLRVLELPRSDVDSLGLWNLFKRLPDLQEVKFPDHFHLPLFIEKFNDNNIREDYEQPLFAVRSLDLFQCTISISSLQHLMELMPNLESLSLSAVSLVDDNCYVIPFDETAMMSMSGLLFNLKELDLSNIAVQKRNIPCLIKAIPALNTLTLLNCKLTEQEKYDCGITYPHVQFY